ncbi:MAG: nicotinamide-nucleotide amidohydrolase family protein [Candidatus Latescibacteria bacterium]|nr:nicotinamide-nucleotide amidohydrolase family protein [bacterium]MBD3423840.1 nicotinamide-nucleotide amidohydrolase family protein [Candidatus Latescibacterota bacterium]
MKFEIISFEFQGSARRCFQLAGLIESMGGMLTGISFLPEGTGSAGEKIAGQLRGNDLLVVYGSSVQFPSLREVAETQKAPSQAERTVLSPYRGSLVLMVHPESTDGEVREALESRLQGMRRPVLGICRLDSAGMEEILSESLPQGLMADLRVIHPLPMVSMVFAPPGSMASDMDSAAERLGSYLFCREYRSLSSVVLQLLREKDMTLAVAESITGGLLASELIAVPGASRVLMEGFITYSNEAKVETLDIDPELIRSSGAVSAGVAVRMASEAASISSADYALSTTGIAGPSGATPEKDVGLCYIGLRTPEGIYCAARQFSGNREEVRYRTVVSALDILRLSLSGYDDRLKEYKA